MAATILFDQVGLPAGTPGQARTDGLDTGATVTVTNASGQPCRCEFWWIPPDDTTAALSQNSAVQWEFDPQAARYGEYIVRMIEAEGTANETEDIKAFAIRLPVSDLVIPGLNSRGDFAVNLSSSAQEKSDAAAISFQNEPMPGTPAINYANWWQSQRELYERVEALSASPPGDEDGVNVQVWEPLYAGTSPNVHATFDLAHAAALASDGPGLVVMQIGASSVFAMPDTGPRDGDGRLTLVAPQNHTGLIQLDMGETSYFDNWLGCIGTRIGLLQLIGLSNLPFFNCTIPGMMPKFTNLIQNGSPATRRLVDIATGEPGASIREVWIGHNVLTNPGDVRCDGALAVVLYEPNSQIAAGFAVPFPAHSDLLYVRYYFDHPNSAANIGAAWTGAIVTQWETDSEVVGYTATTPANWPEFGSFPQSVSASLNVLAARSGGGGGGGGGGGLVAALSWAAQGIPGALPAGRAVGAPVGDGLFASTDNSGNIFLSRNGVTWSNAGNVNAVGSKISSVAMNDLGQKVIGESSFGGAGSNFFYSMDRGFSWSEVNRPPSSFGGGVMVVWTGSEFVAVSKSSRQFAYAADPSTLWTLGTTVPIFNSIVGTAVNPATGEVMCITFEGIFLTDDLSATWQNLTSVMSEPPDSLQDVDFDEALNAWILVGSTDEGVNPDRTGVWVIDAATKTELYVSKFDIYNSSGFQEIQMMPGGEYGLARTYDACWVINVGATEAIVVSGLGFQPDSDNDGVFFRIENQLVARGAGDVGQFFFSGVPGGGSGGGSGLVTSVFGRIGAVVAVSGDYLSSQVADDSSVGGADVAESLDLVSAAISNLLGPTAPQDVTKQPASAGVSAEAARVDHKHDILTGTPTTITDLANNAGVSTELVRADHQHAHGNRGGGSLHALASNSGAGFAPSTAGQNEGFVLALNGGLTPTWGAPATPSAFPASVNSVGSVGTQQDDWDIGATDDLYLVNFTAAVDVTGILAPTGSNPAVRWIVNVGGATPIFRNADGDSAAANQFSGPASQDVPLPPGCTLMLYYEGPSVNRWRVVGVVQGGEQFIRGNPLDVDDQNISNVNSFSYADEFDNGNVSGTVDIDFTTNGQKQRMTMTGDVTALDFIFPAGVSSGFVLMIEQDGAGGRAITFDTLASKQARGASLDVSTAANSVTAMFIHWDGSVATISTIPDLQTSPTVTLV